MAKNDDIKKPLKEWLSEFYDDTATISDLVRKLALAGIGIIWIFKNTDLSHDIIPKELIPPLKLIVIGLIIDLFQYVWRAINISIFYHSKASKYDKGKLTDDDIADTKIGLYVPIITWLSFIAKIICIGIAYYYLYQFLLTRI